MIFDTMLKHIKNSEELYCITVNKQSLNTDFDEIDHSRYFIHEHLTQLYHSELYGSLDERHKKRYNQLFALRCIEQLMTLEASFIGKILGKCRSTGAILQNTELQYCMQEMQAEEKEHYNMFLKLNKKAEPDIYSDNDMYFAKHTFLESAMLHSITKLPGILPFLVWTILLLEEFSVYISKQMIKPDKENCISLESNFITAHREHLKDEARHVHICANILDELCKTSSSKSLIRNAFVFRLFMREYLTPRHGGVRVISRLIYEFPELRGMKSKMINSISATRYKQPICSAINDPASLPVTRKMLSVYPMFKINCSQSR